MLSRVFRRTKPARVCQLPRVSLMTGALAHQSVCRMTTSQETPFTELVRDFLEPQEFYDCLKSKNMDFFAGVPDSLLKDFCAYVSDHTPKSTHIMTVNEGNAVAVAAGYHLATKKFPVVYMQNSGFGNIVNPLTSMADPRVYGIPMLLMIGWRGEPGKKDEPQHMVQGKLMTSLLVDLDVRFEVLPDFMEGAEEALDSAIHHMETRKAPYAFLVKRQTFSPYKLKSKLEPRHIMNREQALEVLVGEMGPYDISVGTTGFLSRELYELREHRGFDHSHEFLCVGSMGHASSIAYGVAAHKPSRQVFCLDGDGAALMHLGAMTTIGTKPLDNYKHILFNNGAHDSVGGHITGAFDVDFCGVAKAVGYREAFKVREPEELRSAFTKFRTSKGPAFMEILINGGARKDLGRPKKSTQENKEDFMRFLSN